MEEHVEAAGASLRAAVESLMSSGEPPDYMAEVKKRRWYSATAWRWKPVTAGWYLGSARPPDRSLRSEIHVLLGQDGHFYVGTPVHDRKAFQGLRYDAGAFQGQRLGDERLLALVNERARSSRASRP